MCGAFALFEEFDLGIRFQIEPIKTKIKPSYNIRPSHWTPVIYDKDGKKSLEQMRFGMIPVWAKDEKIGYKMFNARSETLFEKPAWKRTAKSQRCLIPANGFYEWQAKDDGKHPMFIHPKDRPIFTFAGVYDQWTNKDTGEVINSFAIITTTPNKEMKPIHDRMPVILSEDEEDDWLAGPNDEDFLKELLDPYPNGEIEMYEVSKEVNSARNQGPELIVPLKK